MIRRPPTQLSLQPSDVADVEAAFKQQIAARDEQAAAEERARQAKQAEEAAAREAEASDRGGDWKTEQRRRKEGQGVAERIGL